MISNKNKKNIRLSKLSNLIIKIFNEDGHRHPCTLLTGLGTSQQTVGIGGSLFFKNKLLIIINKLTTFLKKLNILKKYMHNL